MVHPWPLRAPTWKSPPFSTCRKFQAVLCFLHFSWHFRLFSFFFFCFLCARVLGTRHRERAQRRRGCQRVLAGKGGLQGARSPLSCLGVVCASRHEGSMNGLCLTSICIIRFSMYEYIRVVRDCKVRFKWCLFFATGLKLTEGATQSEQQHCRAGERRPR